MCLDCMSSHFCCSFIALILGYFLCADLCLVMEMILHLMIIPVRILQFHRKFSLLLSVLILTFKFRRSKRVAMTKSEVFLEDLPSPRPETRGTGRSSGKTPSKGSVAICKSSKAKTLGLSSNSQLDVEVNVDPATSGISKSLALKSKQGNLTCVVSSICSLILLIGLVEPNNGTGATISDPNPISVKGSSR